MPRATVNQEETERVELKTCPEGFVILRRMTYGQLLHRRSMAMHVKVEGGKGRDAVMGMALANSKVTEFEFATCIVEHNLEDEHGTNLNFTVPTNINKLDPRIGEEIDANISRMNNFEDDDEGNS